MSLLPAPRTHQNHHDQNQSHHLPSNLIPPPYIPLLDHWQYHQSATAVRSATCIPLSCPTVTESPRLTPNPFVHSCAPLCQVQSSHGSWSTSQMKEAASKVILLPSFLPFNPTFVTTSLFFLKHNPLLLICLLLKVLKASYPSSAHKRISEWLTKHVNLG